MSIKTDAIKKAVIGLTDTERQEILTFLQTYQKGTMNEQRMYADVLNKSLGPINGNTCPVCGK